ncbi:zinc ribbon domain-containing protein [Streptomonospora wellingtoniae]|uniref:C4-type zinc ribbon domain-containing protein n=1 Tax=Streptomonospora wellingtoniae TaxID=3075544 RepID=A0ABU2KUN7_9ACTN|nr:C4-type zinc ribbon domain-containing protein [Streptomonospora sp. DSM 45055]MDT0303004.1 C4-type zinc ribbon domain-containing protein [Streptomonospora sp. DSM 45055]
MKAESAHQLRLLDLQEIDSRLAQLAHRLRHLPEHEEVERLDSRISELRDRRTVLATALSDLDREQRKAESDVDQVRTRSERDSKRLDAGQVSSPKDLEHLQSEIASLQRRQTELEEIVLEVMERREGLEAEEAELRKELEAAETERDAADERRGTARAEIESDRAAEFARRERIAEEVPGDLAAFYTKLRDQHDGVGAAALRYGRCEGCKLALSTAELSEIRQAPEDEVLRCDQCRRILVRTGDSGL